MALFIIFLFLVLISLIIAAGTEDEFKLIPILFALVFFMVFAIISTNFVDGKKSYKQGQIDYHNGIIKYELKMKPDSTVIWEEIK